MLAFGRPFEELVPPRYSLPFGALFWQYVVFYGAIVSSYAIRFGQLNGGEERIAGGLTSLRPIL